MNKTLLLFMLTLGLLMPCVCISQSGCTSMQSCNYDPAAIVDDGSCYGSSDLDCNFRTDVLDYLLFMQHYGCAVSVNDVPTAAVRCDLNSSGNINIEDLILLISELGDIYEPNE
jgi:hypothetical protein